jgi:hypothetical protein
MRINAYSVDKKILKRYEKFIPKLESYSNREIVYITDSIELNTEIPEYIDYKYIITQEIELHEDNTMLKPLKQKKQLIETNVFNILYEICPILLYFYDFKYEQKTMSCTKTPRIIVLKIYIQVDYNKNDSEHFSIIRIILIAILNIVAKIIKWWVAGYTYQKPKDYTNGMFFHHIRALEVENVDTYSEEPYTFKDFKHVFRAENLILFFGKVIIVLLLLILAAYLYYIKYIILKR